jgi:bifunctional DNase/RNase
MYKMIEAEIWTIARTDQGNAVLLRPLGSNLSVPIFIGRFETQAILIGFGETAVPRPLTHDLLLNVVEHLGLELTRVEIHELRDGTFHARLILLGKDYSEKNPLVLDARPSDALALAVRRKCPVFISEEVVELAGVLIDVIINAAAGSPAPEGLDPGNSTRMDQNVRREALQMELEAAVEAEEYERAAEIRDMLALLDKENRKKRR